MSIPKLEKSKRLCIQTEKKRLLVVAEGFEPRALSWIKLQEESPLFTVGIICRYTPTQASGYEKMLSEAIARCTKEPITIEFNRYYPAEFEQRFLEQVDQFMLFDEIYIDISAMSKMLILIIMCALNGFGGKLSVIYTEPKTWGPCEEQFDNKYAEREKPDNVGSFIGLSSIGVHELSTTNNLKSTLMQGVPIILVAFTSFNERLVNALVDGLNPSELILINNINKREPWRGKAMNKIYSTLEEDYRQSGDNVIFSYNMLDGSSVFAKLAEIYKNSYYNRRMVISPTGGKIHAVACALFKLCCPDVHIEYPTPESFMFEDFSSEEIEEIYEMNFTQFKRQICNIATLYSLNQLL